MTSVLFFNEGEGLDGMSFIISDGFYFVAVFPNVLRGGEN